MLEVVYGRSRNEVAVQQVAEKLESSGTTGTLYVGYPILASVDQTIFVDALLVADSCGLVVIDVSTEGDENQQDYWPVLEQRQDSLYFALANNLGRHTSLRAGRELAVKPTVVSVMPTQTTRPAESLARVTDVEGLPAFLAALPPLELTYSRALNAALQRVTTIKPPKQRMSVQQRDSRGAVLKRIEKEIANLDRWQRKAAIETPEGPQRIRGLAGSGKTVVLAFKAAYLHAQNPGWNIALTFQTQSLYQQLRELVRRFMYEHSNDEPDFDRLQVMHAWGSSRYPGLYADTAQRADKPVRDFLYGKTKYGAQEAFHGACLELLNSVGDEAVEPVWDAVLIDEAQDLPWPFFRLIYKFTKDPKRIVWAYDELQNLGSHQMPDLGTLFGRDGEQRELVTLANTAGKPSQDIVLPVCYRNTPWALTLGHALGFGIYREQELVQLFDEPSLWSDIGYEVAGGELRAGCSVTLDRKEDSYPGYFKELLKETDAVQWKTFGDPDEQAAFVADEISQNLSADELEPDDILVIVPEPFSAKNEGMRMVSALAARGIASHIAGVTTSRDEMFSPGSVAISGIYRAKGNEAPMVYIVNCHDCFGGRELIRLRNTLFTAVTRSRAWVRLYGCGDAMEKLIAEMTKTREAGYKLTFTMPTPEKLQHLRMIHRDRSAVEKARLRAARQQLEQFVKSVRAGQLALEDLPEDLRAALREVLEDE